MVRFLWLVVIMSKDFPPMLWYYVTQANIAQKVCVNFVFFLECCKRQELSYLV